MNRGDELRLFGGELRTDNNVIIVNAGVASSALTHTLGKVCQNFLSFLSQQPNSVLNISFSIFLNYKKIC